MNTFQDLAPRGTEQGVFMDFFRSLTGALLASFLVACGGGTTDQPQEASSGQRVAVTVTDTGADLTRGTAAGLSSPSYGTPAQGVDLVEMKQRLAKRFNGRFANEPEALMGDRGAYPAAKASWVNRKSFNRQPAQVHRFLNSITGAHFYTASDAEKAVIENSLPQFKYEGRAFFVLGDFDVPLRPVYRFYSVYTGTHFYTISEDEMYFVRTNYAEYFNYEGVAWWATPFAGPGWVPIHRFFNNSAGTHFYTASEAERLNVIATAPHMEYEGIGYYVRSNGGQLPISPISAGNPFPSCIRPGSLYGDSCAFSDALPRSSEDVEGRRVYGGVERFNVVGDCAIDTYTGLVWERKTASGVQDHALRFTHLDSTEKMQVMTRVDQSLVPRAATEAEVLAETNSQGYVNRINSMALCGYTDWRLPSASELVNVVDFGSRRLQLPPYTYSGRYLTADAVAWNLDTINGGGQPVRYEVDGTVAATTDFEPVQTNPDFSKPVLEIRHRAEEALGSFVQSEKFSILLVRGVKAPSQSRFSVISLPYGRDQPNNAVLDNWTHLQWRRCLEGQFWNGSACTGTATPVNLYSALYSAVANPGWRLPGIKELDSLYHWDAAAGQPFLDVGALPSGGPIGQSASLWSATFHSEFTDPFDGVVKVPAYQASFGNSGSGVPAASLRLVGLDHSAYVRLTRVHP